MAKQLYEITDFSGGLNCYADSRDIDDKEFSQNWNVVVDKNGILRIIGSAVPHIRANHFTNENSKKGYGLFQFNTDYDVSISGINGSIHYGIEWGTVVSATNAYTFVIEETTTVNISTNDAYVGMIIYIFTGTNAGESRIIDSYDKDTRTIGIDSTEAFTAEPDDTSEYKIFNWTVNDWEFNDNEKDMVIGNYLSSRKTSITSFQTKSLGHVEYTGIGGSSDLTLTPGIEYTLSFDMMGGDKWYGMVSDGNEDGSTSSNYGDKVPWVQLYSTTVADSSGTLKTVHDATPTVGESNLIGGVWQINQTHYDIIPDSVTLTSGGVSQGGGCVFNIKTDGSGNPTFYLKEGGGGFNIDDIIKVIDPGSSSNYANLIVESVNRVGLSLYNGNQDVVWMNQNDNDTFVGATPSYLQKVYSNYVNFGNTPASHFDTSDSQHITASNYNNDGSYLQADNYGGVNGSSLWLSSTTAHSWSSGVPSGYVKNSTAYELDCGTWYDINFAYLPETQYRALHIAVFNTTTNEYLYPWTELSQIQHLYDDEGWAQETLKGYELYPKGNWNFLPPFAQTNGNKQGYIKFFVPRVIDAPGTSTSFESRTINAEIRFSGNESLLNHESILISGLTLHKAHNDLVTMSQDDENASNPYKDSFKEGWSNYKLKFTVPDTYSKVSDWKLRIYGGKYGYKASNLFEAADANIAKDENTIALDNIKLSAPSSSFEESSNVGLNTLMANNTESNSQISLWDGEHWDDDFIVWPNLNAEPCYDYIQGMLKISDGNFNNTENRNRLMYYNKEEGRWRHEFEGLSQPTSISVTSSGNPSFVSFNANPYLNRLYADFHFWNTLWDMDNFDDDSYNEDTSNGFVIRHIYPNSKSAEQVAASGWTQLLQRGSTTNRLTNGGFKKGGQSWSVHQYYTGSQGQSSELSGHGGGAYLNFSGDSSRRSMRVLNCLVHAYGVGGGLGIGILDTIDSSQIKAVQSIEYRIRWNGVTWSNTSIIEDFQYSDVEAYAPNGCRVPYITVKAHKTDSGSVGNIQDIIDNQTIASHSYTPVSDSPGYEKWLNGSSIGTSGDGIVSSSASVVAYNQWTSNVTYAGALNFPVEGENSIQMNANESNDILIQIEEMDGSTSVFTDTTSGNARDIRCCLTTAIWEDYGSPPTEDYEFVTWSDIQALAPSSSYPMQYDSNPGSTEFPVYTRFFVEELKINFYPSLYQNVSFDGVDTAIDIQLDTPSDFAPSGWGGRDFTICTTTVNYFDEESPLGQESNNISNNIGIPEEDQAPRLVIYLRDGHYGNNFIKKTKIYMKDAESSIWYLQAWVDHSTGKMYSSTSPLTSFSYVEDSMSQYKAWALGSDAFQSFNEVNSYQSETLVSQEDASDYTGLTCRYKASVVCNNRLYVGNIQRDGENFGDRMIKSPIGKYNILPKSNFVDVAINDGDEITALSYYKDKLLQFKRRKVFVINVSGDYEFLEDTFHDIGIQGQYSITSTPYGVVWANQYGCFLYDGEKVENLIEGKIPTTLAYTNRSISTDTIGGANRWCANSSTGDCVVGYMRDKQTILVNFTKADTGLPSVPSGATYNFPTKSWTFIFAVWNNSNISTHTGDMSNMITNENGDIMFYHRSSSDNNRAEDGPFIDTIRKWTHEPDDNLSTKNAYFTTKDITFDAINVLKKLYRVYVTYRVKTDGTDSGVKVEGAVNGKGFLTAIEFSTSSKFLKTSTNCYASSNLDETDGLWKTAELKFATPSDVNNITSFQMRFRQNTSVAYDFEINDISISYRLKKVK